MPSGHCQTCHCRRHISDSCMRDRRSGRHCSGDIVLEFLLEESKLLSRAHSLDLLDLCETVCILCILGLADFLVEDLVLFAFTGMASSQHGIFIGNALSLRKESPR